MAKKRKENIQNAVLVCIAILFLLPLIWLVLASVDLQATQSIKLPSNPTMKHFASVLGDEYIRKGFYSSFVLSGAQTVIVVVASIMAAYPLSRFRLKKAQNITLMLLFLTALPMIALMVPVYQMFILMGLVDSMVGTILFMSATALPYGIWMTKNFLDTVSIEIEEAAWIDGASVVQSIRYVVMPLMLPGLMAVGIFTFVRSWGNFFIPFILIQSQSKFPAAVKLYRFFDDRGGIDFGPLCAYSILYIMPAILLYSLAQRYMSKGFALTGAAKG